MFLILGTPRSGTTLLAQTLNAHSRIAVPHETDFIVPMAFVCDRVRDPDLGRRMVADFVTGGADFPASLGEFLSADEARHAVRSAPYAPADMLAALYGAVARKCGKPIAGDKSPNDLNFVRILHKTGVLAPPMRVVHLVRDVRDVVVSLRRTGWAPDLEHYFPRQWSNNNLYLAAAMAGDADHYLLLRYEDLVADPATWIARICAFLGADFESAMLAPRARQHERYAAMPHHARLGTPISGDGVGQFAEDLPPRLRAACERQAAEALQVFGYGTPSGAMPPPGAERSTP